MVIAELNFFQTGFDVSDLEFLLPLNLDFIKIPSGDLTNYFLLEKAGGSGKDIILSTGMAAIDEISEALTVIKSNLTLHNVNITLLHCTTDYPAQLGDKPQCNDNIERKIWLECWLF